MAYGYAPPRDPTEVLGRRIAAFLIDGAFLAVISAILLATAKHSTYTGAPAGACDGFNPTGTSSICIQSGSHLYLWSRSGLHRATLYGGLLGFLDLVVLQGLTGASLGKLCLGLRVIDKQGRKANFLRMIGRWLFLTVDAACFIVGLVTTLASHPHRRVGDFVCGTYVVATGSVGMPIGVYGSVPGGHDPNVSWPAPVAVPIPAVPTPSPTSQWDSTATPGPTPAPAPQWGRPPDVESSTPPVVAPPVAPLTTTSEAWAKPPVPTESWPPAPAPPPPAGAAVSAPTSFPLPPPIEPEPEPERDREPEPEREVADEPPPVRPPPTWSSVAPSPQRWSPVAPASSGHDPAPVAEPASESKAEEWWDRALSSDLPDDSDLE